MTSRLNARLYPLLLALTVAAAMLATLASPPAAAKQRPATLQVPLPAPGHVSIETLSATVKKGKPKGLPKRLRLKARNAAALPPSARVLYAQRKIRKKRSTTYALLLLSVNVASQRAKPAAYSSANLEGGDGLFGGSKGENLQGMAAIAMFFGSPVAAEFLQAEAIAEDRRQTSSVGKVKYKAKVAANADLAPPAQAAAIGQTLTDLFKGVRGNNGLVFDQGQGAADPNLDTGYYDDGHSFGWGVKSAADERNVFANLTAFTNGQVDKLVEQIEADMSADVNGDGKVAAPGQTIDTTIGPPIIK